MSINEELNSPIIIQRREKLPEETINEVKRRNMKYHSSRQKVAQFDLHTPVFIYYSSFNKTTYDHFYLDNDVISILDNQLAKRFLYNTLLTKISVNSSLWNTNLIYTTRCRITEIQKKEKCQSELLKNKWKSWKTFAGKLSETMDKGTITVDNLLEPGATRGTRNKGYKLLRIWLW